MKLRKADLVGEISALLGIEPPEMSTGSTEPKEIFLAVNRQLGLGLDESQSKPELAQGIVEGSGERWLPEYESRGDTVTGVGLAAVLTAVRYFLRD